MDGITPAICEDLFSCDDVLTTGNHALTRQKSVPIWLARKNCCANNMAEGLPGKGHVIVQNEQGVRLGVVNLMANLFMAKNTNAFAAADRIKDSMHLGRELIFWWWIFTVRPHLRKWQWVII